MKAEHRKELEKNVLADQMKRFVKGVQSPGSTPIAVWLIGILAVGLFVTWYATTGVSKANSQLWADIEDDTYNKDPSQSLQLFGEISQSSPRTLPGRTARFQQARLLLPKAMEDLGSSALAGANLKQARTLYRQLATECGDDALLTQEALMGAAKAEEALAGVAKEENTEEAAGSLDEALRLYRQLAGKYPDSFLGKQAKERVRLLVDDKTRVDIQKFYADMRQRKKPTLAHP